MNQNIEIESKAMIDENGYQKLLTFFNNPLAYEQTNFYFDTPDFKLRAKSISLRIRNKNEKSELTIKYPLLEGREEINFDIDYYDGKSKIDFSCLKSTSQWPKEISLEDIEKITSLTTFRRDINYQNGLLSIDKNIYNGQVDFEVEFEYKSKKEADEILASLLNELGIAFEFSKKSKIKRAIDSI